MVESQNEVLGLRGEEMCVTLPPCEELMRVGLIGDAGAAGLPPPLPGYDSNKLSAVFTHLPLLFHKMAGIGTRIADIRIPKNPSKRRIPKAPWSGHSSYLFSPNSY
jgi:hypothetical protein